MQGFKCKVTNASPTARPLGKAQVPVYCKDDQSKCVKGPKQMLAWHQATGSNNIETEPGVTPNYNQKCGWAEGAQTDIFEGVAAGNSSSPEASPPAPSSTVSSTSATITTLSTIVARSSTVAVNDVTTSATWADYATLAENVYVPTSTKPCTRRRPRASARAAAN